MPNPVQAILEVLALPVRREILWRIWDEELPAGDIVDAFDLSAATMSVHLARLREAGLVTMRKDGTFRRYKANKDALRAALPLLATEDEKWARIDVGQPPSHRISRAIWITAATRVSLTPEQVFHGCRDGETYSAWSGVSTVIDGPRWRSELPNGRIIRGYTDVLAPPSLIAFHWDFATGEEPIPGHESISYFRFRADGDGTEVSVHQMARNEQEAVILERIWDIFLQRMEAWASGTATDAQFGVADAARTAVSEISDVDGPSTTPATEASSNAG